MQIGVVRSYTESFFSFKENKVLIKLKCPVFQVVVRDLGMTITSKKIEFRFTEDLLGVEAYIMGRKVELKKLKGDFCDLKSPLWLSTEALDLTEMSDKLRGMSQASGGQAIFDSEFPALTNGFEELLRYANQQIVVNKSTIREFCEKNIELLNNQIRLLQSDKNLYTELMNKI